MPSTKHTALESTDLVKPGTGERAKYSKHLHKFLTRRNAYPLHLTSVWRYDGQLYVGVMYDGDMIGARLNSVLCGDMKTWSMLYIRPSTAECHVDFWPQYVALGRCHIDPEHATHFIDERWDTQGDHRTCLWCGHQQQLHRYEVVQKCARWIPADAQKPL